MKKLVRKKRPEGPYRLHLNLQFGRGVGIYPLTNRRVRTVAMSCLESDFSITIRFADSAQAQSLNRQFRRRRYVPNVLTFSYLPDPVADIVICTPIVRRQAREQHKTFADHLTHLLVHGLLHAQGYQHDHADDARRMENREKLILARLGISDPYLTTP